MGRWAVADNQWADGVRFRVYGLVILEAGHRLYGITVYGARFLENEDGERSYIRYQNSKSYVLNLYGLTFYGLGRTRMDKSLGKLTVVNLILPSGEYIHNSP